MEIKTFLGSCLLFYQNKFYNAVNPAKHFNNFSNVTDVKVSNPYNQAQTNSIMTQPCVGI